MTTTLKQEQISQSLREHITLTYAYDRPNFDLTNDFQMIEQGLIDSISILRLVHFIEEKFEVTLEPEDMLLENFATIDAISKLILSK